MKRKPIILPALLLSLIAFGNSAISQDAFPSLPDVDEGNLKEEINYFTQTRDGRAFVNSVYKKWPEFVPRMMEIIEGYGLPKDLVFLAVVESGLNSDAKSHAGAVGMWQFIAATARRYKLINGHDYRRDPNRSTDAACRYLIDLHDRFGDWPLALAGYNNGEENVAQQSAKYGRDFWMLKQRRLLPAETRQHVTRVFALRNIFANPEKYGFDFEAEDYSPEPVIFVDKSGRRLHKVKKGETISQIAAGAGLSWDELLRYNFPEGRSVIIGEGDLLYIEP